MDTQDIPTRALMLEVLQNELFLSEDGDFLLNLGEDFYAKLVFKETRLGGRSCILPTVVPTKNPHDPQPVDLEGLDNDTLLLVYQVGAWVQDVGGGMVVDQDDPPRVLCSFTN